MAGRVKKRLYYKIGEACKMVGIQPYVLRYWETEFAALNPGKSKSGQRVYGERELALIRRIQQLLYEEGYTIAGAKKKLEAEIGPNGEPEETAEEAARSAATAATESKAAESKAAGDDARTPATNGADERAARLEQGLRAALAEAREILSLLD
jgi:DNA-binding transcriptional MerR regulator